ncbi:hypothetical protein LUZ60_008792 [Juncus effusus]|nr:hypothetical protein LUZ60_008792 [Juncus effusus]
MLAPILPLPAPPSPNSNDNNHREREDMDQDPPEQAAPAPVPTHTRPIGIIHPPPDIRAIVEKTAQFVAKNGPEFERRIVASNAGNPKFKFMTPSDPFHDFYQHRIAEHKIQMESESAGPESEPGLKSKPSDLTQLDSEVKLGVTNEEFRAPVPKKVLIPPPVEQYTVRLPEGITGEELDIIKLTAQFVARNGKSFMEKLMKRAEVGLPQFHFLRPTHSMYTFFTSLADAYSKVLMPEKEITTKLKQSSSGLTVVLERCLNRLEWEKSQEQERQRAEDEIEQERMQMAMIDWHDFIVVETIEFAEDEDEELPIPMSLEEVIRRSKMPALEETEPSLPPELTTKNEPAMEMEMDEEEIHLVEEGMRAARLDASISDEPPMRIVKNWKRPEERIPSQSDPTKFVISPITGELIPINEMAEHMRISLIDPKYKEQKDRMMAKIKETTLAQDDEISRNIVGLAKTRPDIFGTTEEEVSNAVKKEIEKKKDENNNSNNNQVIWDGHSGSIGRTATQALNQNEDEQMKNYNNSTLPGPAAPPTRPVIPSLRPLPPPPGLPLNLPRFPPPPHLRPPGQPHMMPPPVPGQTQQPIMNMMNMMSQPRTSVPLPPGSYPVPGPPGQQRPYMMAGMPPPPAMAGVPPPPPPPEEQPPLPDEPEPKRQRVDDVALVPEDQFASQHPGPACILVSVPATDEGNLKGQLLEITVPSLLETISSLKEKIAGDLQLPANKQKLSSKAGFLKDNLTLAYYNIASGDTVGLSLRERGGRKK